MPHSVRTAMNFINTETQDFIEYVVCSKCHSVYDFKSCFKEDTYADTQMLVI